MQTRPRFRSLVMASAFMWGASFTGVVAFPASALVIAPTFGAGIDANERGVINAAIEWWSMALPDPGLNMNPVQVTFSEAALGGTVLADTLPITSTLGSVLGGGVAGDLFLGRPATVNLRINNAAGLYFVDLTPHTEEEFTKVSTNDPNGFDDSNPFFFNNFAGNAGDAANKFDLLTVIKHELGHALGWDGDFQAFRQFMDGLFVGDDKDNQFLDGMFGALTLEGDGQAGSLNESPSNNINELSHLDRTIYANDLMNPLVSAGVRRLQSPLDIAVLGTAYGYVTNLNPAHVPEPGTIFIFVIGLAGLGFLRHKQEM